MSDFKSLDKQYILNTYKRFDAVLESGDGSVCRDVDGKEYIDLGSGIGVNCLGYSDGGWAAAVSAQAAKLSHCSNLYYSLPQIELARKLCERTGYDGVFFGNSGAEANEGAIKLARKYSFDKYGGGRGKVVTLVNSFHGRTLTALTATGQESYHKFFAPFTPGFEYVAAGDATALEALLKEGACALMLEFIQGEGGVVPLDVDFVFEAERLCRKYDTLLIADEVQTGMGRTGKLLASELYGVTPNITTCAKALGGGLPIGAVLVDAKCRSTFDFGNHGSTFGGNPIVCAGACYVLDTLTPELLDGVCAKGEYIRRRLSECAGVTNVTGAGLMLGAEPTDKSAADVAARCVERGLLILTAKTKIRLLPPLNIPDDVLSKAMDILISVVDD